VRSGPRPSRIRSPGCAATRARPGHRAVQGGWCRRLSSVAPGHARTCGTATRDRAADGTGCRPTPLRTVPFRSGRPRRGRESRPAPGAARPNPARRRQPTTAPGSATRQRWRWRRTQARRQVPGRWAASARTSPAPGRTSRSMIRPASGRAAGHSRPWILARAGLPPTGPRLTGLRLTGPRLTGLRPTGPRCRRTLMAGAGNGVRLVRPRRSRR
jgi:hypothetical protein